MASKPPLLCSFIPVSGCGFDGSKNLDEGSEVVVRKVKEGGEFCVCVRKPMISSINLIFGGAHHADVKDSRSSQRIPTV